MRIIIGDKSRHEIYGKIMGNKMKIAFIGAAAIIIAALITALYSSPSVVQKAECGSAINKTNGNITIAGSNECYKDR